MTTFQSHIDQINRLLSELITVATQLRAISIQVIAEEDLSSLQKRQEELLKELEIKDQYLQEHYRSQIESATWDHFHHQIKLFQELNQEFIQNLTTNQGLIQFELRRLPTEDEDFAPLSRLNKISTSPDSSQAIESQEDE